jgi:hypothetical protein
VVLTLRHVALLAAAALATACSPEADKKGPQKNQPAASAPSKPEPPKPATGTTLIKDAIGVGGAELGLTTAEVEARLGPPVRVNKAGEQVVFMTYAKTGMLDLYIDDAGRVRMIIASNQDRTFCTAYDVCLYREGDLKKLKAHHGAALHRFVDRDGSITYRLLEKKGDKQVMTEYTPVEDRDGLVQVAILYWTGTIDTSGFD